MTVLQRLTDWLTAEQVPFTRVEHEAVYTSEDAARVRGSALASGAKALVCKADQQLVLFVLPADRKLASKSIRRHLGTRQLRFATPDEVLQVTGLKPGSIPPFGSLFGLATYCDQRLAEQPEINFNAGDHCVSFRMTFEAYRSAEQPQLGTFAE